MGERVIGKKPLESLAADAWRAALDELSRADDAEGETSESLAARWGVTRECARRSLNRLVAAGKAELIGHQHRGPARLRVYRLAGAKK